MKNRFSFTMPTLCALAWFGHSCGASMATGRLAVQYCSRHGAIGLLSAVVIWIITVGFAWILMEYGRLIKARNYREVVSTIYWPNKVVGGTMNAIWDLITLFSVIVVSGTCVAGTGALLQSAFGLSYNLGMLLFVALMLVLFLTGSNILQKLGKMSFPMFVLLVILCIVAISMGWERLNEVMAGTYNSAIENGAGTLRAALNDGFTYGLAQSGFVATGIVYAGQFKSRRDVNKACVLGFAMGCTAMLVCTLATLAWFPEINAETLPFLVILQNLSGAGGMFLRAVYYIVLIIAYASTAGSLLTGGIARFKVPLGKLVKNEKACTAVLLVFFLCASILIGRLGLTAVVNKGFKILGNMRKPLWFFPLIILGPISIHRVKKQLAATGAPDGTPQ